jgi:hypothetical protein
MTEACFNCPWKSSAGKLMCSLISPDPNYLKSTCVPIYSHFYQYWYCCANFCSICLFNYFGYR